MIIVPISITVNSKRYSLTMNNYRNVHHHVSHKLKKEFTDIAIKKLIINKQKRISGDVSITYTLYFPDNRRRDIGNYGSVIDKFFQDCLVKKEIIPDDCWKYVKEVIFRFGGIDKTNPRCEIEVKKGER